ncbi:MAG TPA: bacterial transcriptional activator domain-containing protein [Streptosporangiaceae bacterium]
MPVVPGQTHNGPGTVARPAPAGPPVFPHELAASSLLAAGLLTALGRRKREQLWQRAFGSTVARPDGPAAVAESALRLGANPSAVRALDHGLRSLSQELAAQGRIPPAVFAAHIGQVNLDLWIAAADPNPPRPWEPVDDGQVWRLPLAAAAGLDTGDAGAALAPYPGLVSIGTSDTGRMLVDLEVAHGLIAVRGPLARVQTVLAAIAVELATNRWSDRMRITLVGFSPTLAALAPDRITVAATLDEAMPALEARAAEVSRALAAPRTEGTDSGQGNSLLAGRSRDVRPDAWAPHYLISAIPPTPQQRERLLTLARTPHRTAMGYVVAGDVPGAAWSWDVTEQGRLRADVFGFDMRAQMLPPQQCAAVVDLFCTAGLRSGAAWPTPSAGAVPAGQLVPGSRMPVEVSLLGQVAVQAPGGIEPARIGAATEIVAYLAAHPEGVPPDTLTRAIWPRGVAPEVRNTALARVRAWLGSDATGQPNLVTDPAGVLRLGPQVRVDWQVFRSLLGHAVQAKQAAGQYPSARQDEATYLARALGLVHGQLLDGHDPRGYSWLAADPLEYEATAQVADVAHRLCELRLAAGGSRGAMDAARSGLRFACNDEMLWRDLLTAADATGEEHVLRGVVGELSAQVSLDEVLPRMAPQTEALIDELLPSWRTPAA